MTDLDARVAALMKLVDNYAGWGFPLSSGNRFDRDIAEQAIRAELQKPALHEPVTDAEVTRAIGVYLQNRRVPYIRGVSPYTADIRAVLESFLQGRAKPTQKSLTDDDLWAIWQTVDTGAIDPDLVAFAHAVIRASKGEKT